jgi:putative nucleotidyltransferase with HDIG domain
MKLTVYNVKKGLIIAGLILPMLLIQLAISLSYEHTLIGNLVKEREESLKLYGKDLNNSVNNLNQLTVALNEMPIITDEMVQLIESSKNVTLMNSADPRNGIEESQRITNLLKTDTVTLDKEQQNIYFINRNRNYNRILIMKKDLSDLVTDTLSHESRRVDIGLYLDDVLAQFKTIGSLNNYTAELVTIDGDTYLAMLSSLPSIKVKVVILDLLTHEIAYIHQRILTYSFFVYAALLILSILYLKVSKINDDPLTLLLTQLEQIDTALEHKRFHTHHNLTTAYPIQKEIDGFVKQGQKLIKSIETLENQIGLYRNEKSQFNSTYEVQNRSLNDLENTLAVATYIRDEFTDFVDQILMTVTKSLIITNVNRAYLQKMGYSRDEVIGRNIMDFIVEDFESITPDRLLKVTNEPIFLNLRHKTLSETTSEFISLKSIAWDRDQILFIGKSIHEEISLQSRILRKNRELEYINQINTSLISNWGVNELLDNIIRRIDYLFNVEIGTIYVKDSDATWSLKATASSLENEEDAYLCDFESVLTIDGTDLSVIDINALNQKENPFSEEVKYLVISPLEVDQEVIAVMIIGLKAKMKSSDLNVLRMFKNQASIVIQRAILYDQLRDQYFNTIEALVNVIEAKDKYTEGHSRRVSRFSVEIAHEMGYSNEEIENIEIAGLLHDVGKVGINQKILNKIGKLTPEEYEIIKEHPEKGIQILQSIKLDSNITAAIRYHHVRYDLKGYPENHGLTELPAYAAIIGVADAFDAMSSARSYTKPRRIEEAVEELVRCTGTQFAPEVVDAMLKVVEESPQRIQTIIDDLRS